MSEPTAIDRIRALRPDAVTGARAPGRANLIGEHTDYNEGWVLPAALDLNTYVLGKRSDRLRLISLDEPGEVIVDLDSGDGPTAGWGTYVTGVVRALLERGISPRGLDGVVASDVPAGAGLSSSAALEVSIASVLAPGLNGIELATICRRAENHYVGVASGIMDQLTAACGRKDRVLLLDCRNNEMKFIWLPEGVSLLIIDSGVRRDLASSAYNDRVGECSAAAKALGLGSLREATPSDLERLDPEPTLQRRARHVVSENLRVLDTAECLAEGRLSELAGIWHESHRSYGRDFEASTPEIDRLVEITAASPGTIAARLTGGGFGGCTVNLVRTRTAPAIADWVLKTYRREVDLTARAWITRPGPGAESLAGA